MSSDVNEIKEEEVKETATVLPEDSEAEDSKTEETVKEEIGEDSKKEQSPESDESDDDLEDVDLNATDYGKSYMGSIPGAEDEDDIEISLPRRKRSAGKKDNDEEGASSSRRPVRRREKKPVDQYKKKRVRKTIRIFVILGILILLGFLVYFKFIKPAKEAAQELLNQITEQTDTIEKRDITESITTTGTIKAAEVRTLTSTAKDTTIDAVMASVGDTVKEGDTLVMFSTENINKTIEQLQEDLSKQNQKDAIDSRASDRNYLFTYANQSIELSNAAEKVNSTLKDLYEACDGYGDAKRALQDAKNGTTVDVSELGKIAQAAEAEFNLKNQEYTETYNAHEGDKENQEVKDAAAARDEAQAKYAKAIEEYQKASDNANFASKNSIESLEAAVTAAYQKEQAAQVAYDSAVNAQAQLIAKSGNTLTEADENKQKTAITAGDQATNIKRQIEDYQDKIENYVITAPISGLVTNVSVEEGNGFTGGTVMVIQDTETLKISATIDEYDIPNIKLGQRVIIKTDATRDDELMGYVSFIAPTSTTMANGGSSSSSQASAAAAASQSSSSANFEIEITVITKDERLMIGMSAKLNIVVDQVSNVLTVPYDAIQTNAQGDNYITVIDNSHGGQIAGIPNQKGQKGNAASDMPILTVNGQNMQGNGNKATAPNAGGPNAADDNRKDIMVTVGMEGDYYTQIISDEIEEGMTVVIPDSGNFGGFDFGAMMNGGF